MNSDTPRLLGEAIQRHKSGDLQGAASLYRRVLGVVRNEPNALRLLGVIEFQTGRLDEAERLLSRAAKANPGSADTHYFLGRVHIVTGDTTLAERNLLTAIRLAPGHADALTCLGKMMLDKMDYATALDLLDRAVAANPHGAEAWIGRAVALSRLRRLPEAVASCDRALALRPNLPLAGGLRLHFRMEVCDWDGIERECSALREQIAAGQPCAPPFTVLSAPLSPECQRRCASAYVTGQLEGRAPKPWDGARFRHDRVRVAYVSSDFRDHPASYLIAGVFEQHDRSRFDITAISLTPEPPAVSPRRERIRAAVDRFVNVHDKTDDEVVRLLRDQECDIAVDLNGLTAGNRFGIFGGRAAPIQVNFLGYPGTMGADFIDYILADPFVIPEADRAHYTEQVVDLPDCCLPNDAARPISSRTPSRADAALPAEGFVFCCFNNSFKITPDVFDVWMRLLAAIEDSALWLSETNAWAVANLRQQAERRGVAADRLIFAPRVPLNEDHLARLRLADLILDTLYYNAHTTAADALWAGVPVLTCAGSTFASRVAGSMLHAIGLPELVTGSLPEYEALALRLARDPALLAGIKAKLAGNRDTCPLFDTKRFTRHLEAAYSEMLQRYRRGEGPESFAVQPLD